MTKSDKPKYRIGECGMCGKRKKLMFIDECVDCRHKLDEKIEKIRRKVKRKQKVDKPKKKR